jgi:hypothetical protein
MSLKLYAKTWARRVSTLCSAAATPRRPVGEPSPLISSTFVAVVYHFAYVLGELLQGSCLVLQGLHLVLTTLVIEVPATFQEQRVYRSLRLV